MTRFAVFALSLLGASAAAQPVAVPGTRAALVPPVGYEMSERFTGFENVALEASLMVLEIPEAPLAEMREGFTPEALAARGVQDAVLEGVTVDGVPSFLVTGRQEAYGQTHRRWSLVTGDSAGVVMVNGAIPLSAPPEAASALRAAVLSVTFGPATPDLFAGLPYTLSLSDALPERRRVGPMLLMGERYGEEQPPGAPMYMMAQGLAALSGNAELDVTLRMKQTAALTDFGPVTTRAITIDGRDGMEARAKALDARSGEPLAVVTVLLPYGDAGGYLVGHAMVGADRAGEWVPRFRAITESLDWTE